MIIPRKCGNVSPQCPAGQEKGYRLGWYQGQVSMADEYNGTPCQVIELENEIDSLRSALATAEAERDAAHNAQKRPRTR